MSGARKKLVQGLVVGAGAAVLSTALWLVGALSGFEAQTWDLRARLFAHPGKATSQVVTILLDQYSFDWGKITNQWPFPWPRQLYGIMADFIAKGGAKAFVLDVVFTEPSWVGVSDDEEFGAGVAKNGRVVAAMDLARSEGQGSAARWDPGVPEPKVTVSGLDAWTPEALSFPYTTFPIPELSKNAYMIANTQLPADKVDGKYRRGPLFNVFDGRIVPCESLAAWLTGNQDVRTIKAEPGRLIVGDRVVPIDSEGNAILRYRGPSLTHRSFTAASIFQAAEQVLEGTAPFIDPSVFKDKYVLFGYSAPGLLDLKPTPMTGAYPGVEVYATMLDNLLSGDFMRELPLPWGILTLLIICMGAGLAVSSVSGAGRSALIYLAFIPLAPALGIAAYALGYWLELVAVELGTIFALVGGSLVNFATEGQQKRYIKGAFKQYLSPAVIEELIAHPERLRLGGERRELTIYFSDLQGFTSLSELLTPEELTSLLNEYLSAMTDIIQEEGGTIDKYEGDAIIAFWNAPLSQEDHAVRGVRASLRCQEKLAEMRPGFRERVGKDLFMRIGLNSGPAVVGNMGSRTRFDYTMLGDAVNLASRLEGINKQFRTYTMASAATMEKAAGAFPARELSRVAVVGRKEPVVVFEPMLTAEFETRKAALQTFGRGLTEYYAGRFEAAKDVFSGIASTDPASAAYAEKCEELIASPPGPGWNGVWVMTSK
jgi:adenylate cyclase